MTVRRETRIFYIVFFAALRILAHEQPEPILLIIPSTALFYLPIRLVWSSVPTPLSAFNVRLGTCRILSEKSNMGQL